MMLQKIFLVAFILNLSAGLSNKEIKFILKFLGGQLPPKSIIENLCLNKDEKGRLQKALTKLDYRYVSFTSSLNGVNLDNRPFFYFILASTECNFDTFINDKTITTLLKYPNIWIVFGNLSYMHDKNYNIPINSFFITPMINDDKTLMKTIYKINKVDDQYTKEYINDTRDINIVENRKNFRKMILRVIYVIQDQNTINHLTDYRDKHIDSPTKINFALYNMVCDMLNCIQIRIFTDDWGFEIFNKTLNRTVFRHGMFKDLMNDKADIAGTVAFMPASRLSYFKYLFAPIKDFSLHFVFKAPPLAFYSNIVVLPFDTLVWLTIGAVLAFCGILINTIFHWEVKQKKFAKELAIYKENEPSLLDVVMMQIAVVCQIDFYYEPKSLSGKITTFTLLIFCTFIYTAFSARIVLLLQSNTNMINSLDTLYATNFEFGVESQSYNKRYFREFSDRADENWRKKIYENKINKRGVEKFFDTEVGMQMVRDSYFTFHIEQTVANHLIQKLFSNTQKCALKFIETIYKPDNPHLSLPRNSPYIEFFAVSFNRLAETGLHNREYRNCFTKRPSCEGRSNTFVSVGLTESYFAFLVFGVGVCTSIILLIIECLVFKYLKK